MWIRLDSLVLDAKHGVRRLARAPLVTGVAVLTLAIGIGLNTAVFSLVHAVLLRPLPFPAAERLVWIAPYDELFGNDTWGSRADYRIWKQQDRLFDGMTAYGTDDLNLVVAGQASQERVASIGGDFWALTGAQSLRSVASRRKTTRSAWCCRTGCSSDDSAETLRPSAGR